MAWYFKPDSIKITGMESGEPELGSLIDISTIGVNKYGVQSGAAELGKDIRVSGGLSPSATIPGCDKSFWTCKQGYKFDVASNEFAVASKQVVDSSIWLLNLTETGEAKVKVDLEPVVFSLIQSASLEGDGTRDLKVASLWINPTYYDRYTRYEPYITAASPKYFDIKVSSAVKVITQIAPGNENKVTNWVRPASYSGILGPVWEGVASWGDPIYRSPWKDYQGPCQSPNIFARDIVTDANGNVWCLLTIGWETIKPYANTDYPNFNCVTAGWVRGYTPYVKQNLDTHPYNTRYWYPANTAAGNTYNAGGIPRMRQFLVCFTKSSNYTEWDYVPFIPGTKGFTPSKGSAIYPIYSPPIKLDVDKYGNVYLSLGSASISDYYQNGIYHIGFAFQEFHYYYAKPNVEVELKTGLNRGRIGGRCYFSTSATGGVRTSYNSNAAYPNDRWERTPTTFSFGGDMSTLIQYGAVASWEKEYYFHLAVGNKCIHRLFIEIDYSADFPHPGTTTNYLTKEPMLRYDGPTQIRDRASEFRYTGTNVIQRQQGMLDYGCLYAQCDLLEYTVYQQDIANGLRPYNLKYLSPSSYFNYLQDWPSSSAWPTRVQLNPYQGFNYMVGSGDSEGRYVGGTIPDYWYNHFTRRSDGTPVEFECRAFTYNMDQSTAYPLYAGNDPDKNLLAVASMYLVASPYHTYDQFEKNCRTGAFPILPTRVYKNGVSIFPKLNLKYDIFEFTSMSWDSTNVYYTKRPSEGGTDTQEVWPYRWHSMKAYPDTASTDEYTGESILIQTIENTSQISGSLIRYKDNYADSMEILDLNGLTALKQEILDKIKDIKTTYYGGFLSTGSWVNGIVTDLKWGNFGDTVKCENACGFLVRQIEISLDVYYDDEEDTWVYDLTYDPWVGHRVYTISQYLTPTREMTEEKNNDTKSWWDVASTWPDNQVAEIKSQVLKISWKDLPNDHIQKLKEWTVVASEEYMERMCGFSYSQKWRGLKKSPKFYKIETVGTLI